jgi:hypothetical protein
MQVWCETNNLRVAPSNNRRLLQGWPTAVRKIAATSGHLDK